MITDPIADMLARIKNAAMRKHEQVRMPLSKIKLNIAEVLKQEGYINNYEFAEKDNKGELTITLKYVGNRLPFSTMKRVSKPGVRRYVSHEHIPFVLHGMGIAIISTSQGVMTGHRAKKLGIGGEVLCLVH